MFDRYRPPDHHFLPLQEEEDTAPARPSPPPRGKEESRDLLGGLAGGLGDILGRIFEGFSLKNLDSGDILLILIILFLLAEGDNLDLVIALGVMLLLGLGEKSPNQPPG